MELIFNVENTSVGGEKKCTTHINAVIKPEKINAPFCRLKVVKVLEASFHVFPQCSVLKDNWGNLLHLRGTAETFCSANSLASAVCIRILDLTNIRHWLQGSNHRLTLATVLCLKAVYHISAAQGHSLSLPDWETSSHIEQVSLSYNLMARKAVQGPSRDPRNMLQHPIL